MAVNYVEILINEPATAKLDLNEEFNIGLQYSVADIRDISKRNTAYSKTITLPGTKNNNYWFGNLYDVNADFTFFNPNKKTSCKILVNSETVINGFLQLKNIRKLNNVDHQGNQILYECVVYDNAVDLMTELGEKTIDELDLSDYEHKYDKSEIESSWSNTYEDGYVYPMYGTNTSGPQYDAEWFWPSMFYWTLLDRTLFEAGYGWTGSLKTNDQFQKEILAYATDGRPKISETERRRREFRAGVVPSDNQIIATFSLTNYSFSSFNQANDADNFALDFNFFRLQLDDDSNGDNFDNAGSGTFGNYNTSTFIWETDRAGKFSASYRLKGNLKVKNPNLTGSPATMISPQGQITQTPPHLRYGIKSQIYYRVPGSSTWTAMAGTFNQSPTLLYDADILGYDIALNTSVNIGQIDVEINGTEDDFPLFTEFILKVWGYYYGNTQEWRWNREMALDFEIDEDSYFKNTAISSELTQGDILDLGSYLPDKLKQKDLITDLIKRYNLYITVDADNPNLLIFDTRPDYYESGEILDWTKKKDYSSEDKIELLSELQFKEIHFTYKEDKDEANEDYTAETGDIYGEIRYNFDNDFVKGEKKIESPFSPTPLVATDFGAIVPWIDPQSPKINPRVLYYSGTFSQADISTLQPWSLEWIDTTTGLTNLTSYNYYPYAGHFDNPIEPSLDINFFTPKKLYYSNWEYMTNSNMYNTYWSNYVKQIENGRLVTSKFYLDEIDIRFIKSNFNTKIFVLDSYYYVNKIKDYNPLENGVTEVELIKVVDGITWEGNAFGEVGGSTFSNPFDDVVRPSVPGLPDIPVVGPVTPPAPVKPYTPIGKDWGINNKAGVNTWTLGDYNVSGGRYYYELDSVTYSKSTYNFIFGNYNNINGQFSNVIGGSNNVVEGSNVLLEGTSNSQVYGDNVRLFGSEGAYVEGSNITLFNVNGGTYSESNRIYLGPNYSINIADGTVNAGRLILPFRRSNVSTSIDNEDYILEVYGTQSGISVTLPQVTESGRVLHIKNLMDVDYPVEVESATASEYIDGTYSSIRLDRYDGVALSSTNDGWIII